MPLYCEIQCAVYSPTGNLTWICLSRLCLRHAVRFPARSASDISVDPAGNPAGVKLRPRSAQHLCKSSRFHSLRTHCRYGCDLDEICNRSTTRPLYHYWQCISLRGDIYRRKGKSQTHSRYLKCDIYLCSHLSGRRHAMARLSTFMIFYISPWFHAHTLKMECLQWM